MLFLKGNAARKFFDNWESVSKLLRIPEYFLKDLGTIWHVLAACEPIDSVKFGNFCRDFVAKFNADSNINWYQFCPSTHKILGMDHVQMTKVFCKLKVNWNF